MCFHILDATLCLKSFSDIGCEGSVFFHMVNIFVGPNDFHVLDAKCVCVSKLVEHVSHVVCQTFVPKLVLHIGSQVFVSKRFEHCHILGVIYCSETCFTNWISSLCFGTC